MVRFIRRGHVSAGGGCEGAANCTSQSYHNMLHDNEVGSEGFFYKQVTMSIAFVIGLRTFQIPVPSFTQIKQKLFIRKLGFYDVWMSQCEKERW